MPNTPDPDKLSLTGLGTGTGREFSDVRSGSSTAAGTGGAHPDFSDVRTGSSTVAGTGAGAQSYTVRKGDTLSEIAERHYGKASQWHAIFDANRDSIDDPDKIFPGQVLRLP